MAWLYPRVNRRNISVRESLKISRIQFKTNNNINERF